MRARMPRQNNATRPPTLPYRSRGTVGGRKRHYPEWPTSVITVLHSGSPRHCTTMTSFIYTNEFHSLLPYPKVLSLSLARSLTRSRSLSLSLCVCVRARARAQVSLRSKSSCYSSLSTRSNMLTQDAESVWMVGTNIYPRQMFCPSDLPLKFFGSLRCLDWGVNVGELNI
jgi:hypothetical protein